MMPSPDPLHDTERFAILVREANSPERPLMQGLSRREARAYISTFYAVNRCTARGRFCRMVPMTDLSPKPPESPKEAAKHQRRQEAIALANDPAIRAAYIAQLRAAHKFAAANLHRQALDAAGVVIRFALETHYRCLAGKGPLPNFNGEKILNSLRSQHRIDRHQANLIRKVLDAEATPEHVAEALAVAEHLLTMYVALGETQKPPREPKAIDRHGPGTGPTIVRVA